jgi:hypothetical protein
MVNRGGGGSSALREISSLMELSHPNIVELIDVVPRGNKLFMVLELLDTDLKRVMDITYGQPLPLRCIRVRGFVQGWTDAIVIARLNLGWADLDCAAASRAALLPPTRGSPPRPEAAKYISQPRPRSREAV